MPPSPSPSPQRLAAIQRHADAWSLVVADCDTKVTIIDARSIPSADLVSTLSHLLKKGGVARILAVLPGGHSVCRAVSLPDGAPAELAAAAQLMAEAQLSESIPPYRRAAGLIPEPLRPTRTALLTAWQDPAPDALPTDPLPDFPFDLTWSTPIAALAFLRGPSASPALYADPADASIAVLADDGQRTLARILREDNSSPAAWAESVSNAMLDVGGPAVSADAHGPTLTLDRESLSTLRSKVSGLHDDRAWLARFALPIGALLLASSANAGSTSLASLRARPPRREESLPERALALVASPPRAVAVLAAALALAVFAPLAFAFARFHILESKAATLSIQQSGRAELERSAALYRQLEQSRLPMAKLLATISVATPQNIVATTIRLSPDQGFSMQGLAKSAGDVNQLQANLNSAGVFTDIKINRTTSKGEEGVEFDVSAERIKPEVFNKFQPKDDWAAKPLAVRLYGEGASNLNVAGSEKKTRPSRRASTSSDDSSESKRAESSRRPSESSSGPPAPLSDGDIKKMDRATAMKEFAARRKYLTSNPNLDNSTKSRVTDEVDKLKSQMSAAASSPPPTKGGAK
jgi:Tfp pilus assembly protein PilN